MSSGYRHVETTIAVDTDNSDVDIQIQPLVRDMTVAEGESGDYVVPDTSAAPLLIEAVDFSSQGADWYEHLNVLYAENALASEKECMAPSMRVTITGTGGSAVTWDVHLRECSQKWLYLKAQTVSGTDTTLHCMMEGVA